MDRKYDHNSSIVFVDSRGQKHAALVTAWWGIPAERVGEYGSKLKAPDGQMVFGSPVVSYESATGEPGCNLVYVSSDAERTDNCGRQMERATSVVHKSKQPAHGMYWCWPDEV